jgi:hypothetical protein
MIPVAWLAAFGGSYLVWAAITNRNPISALRAALTGDPEVATLTERSSSAGGAGGGAAGGASAGISRSPAGGPPTDLVSIGYGSHRLAAPAAAAYKTASIKFGRPIPITDSVRSYEQQADCYRRKPDLCAKPSYNAPHVRGYAIDVDGNQTGGYENPRLLSALSSSGWVRNGKRVNGKPEVWHWEFVG